MILTEVKRVGRGKRVIETVLEFVSLPVMEEHSLECARCGESGVPVEFFCK